MKLFDSATRLWEKPQVPVINTLRPRSPLFTWNSVEEAREGTFEPFDCPAIESLNGEWQFRYFERPEAAESALADGLTGAWEKIAVPGNWTRQGYDKPHYTNAQMPFGDLPPRVPADHNPTGIYQRAFKLREGAERVVLHFGGVESCAFVIVNGNEIGMMKDSRTASEFDITDFVHPGENLLQAVVIRFSDGSFLEDQDHWKMAGIYRDVYLQYTPKAHIRDFFAQATLAEDNTTGILKIRLDAEYCNRRTAPDNGKFAVQLWDGDKPLLQGTTELGFYSFWAQVYYPENKEPYAEYEWSIPKIRPWSAETPNLYRVTVALLDENGAVIEATGTHIGFKRVELKDGCVCINGQPVKFFGVNRHDMNEYTGKTVSIEDMAEDLRLMKFHNFNAVRTCHYPNDERLAALCDRIGLYMISEANIESHAYYYHLCDDAMWLPAMMDRMRRMVLIYKDHACIHMWSMGNESGESRSCFGALSAWTHNFDPTRLVHYEGLNHRTGCKDPVIFCTGPKLNEEIVDVVAPMYPAFEAVDQWIEQCMPFDRRPLIMCEYSHAMGNSNGSLAHYFERFRKYPRLQGGYIWDWIDQGLAETDAKGRKYWCYGGDYGDQPNDFDFCINGMILPDRTPHPSCLEHKSLARNFNFEPVNLPAMLFKLTNWNYFTTLEELSFTWKIEIDGELVQHGVIPYRSYRKLKPQESMQLTLNCDLTSLRLFWKGAEAFLTIGAYYRKDTAWARKGDEAAVQQFDLTAVVPAAVPLKASSIKRPKCKNNAVWGNDGLISEWHIDGMPLLAKPMELQFVRGLTDNDGIKSQLDCAWRVGAKWKEWDLFHLMKTVETAIEVNNSNQTVSRNSAHLYCAKNGAAVQAVNSLTQLPDGSILCKIEYNVPEELGDMPRLGVTIPLPAGFENFTFFGKGPQECYCDRQTSACVGCYEQSVSGQYFPYVQPQETGNHTGVRFAAVDNGKIGLMAAALGAPFECSALHYTPEQLFNAHHINELEPTPETYFNIDFMQRGLGTATCGEDTLPQYRIRAGHYRLYFRLVPFCVGEDLAMIARSV